MTPLTLPGPIVSIHWLAGQLGHPHLVLLDASLKPMAAASAQTSTMDGMQLPGTRRFDFDKRICVRIPSHRDRLFRGIVITRSEAS